MTRCPPICGKGKREEVKREVKKVKKDEDEETLRKLVPQRFWKWRKVFGKKESERMPVRKAWDHAIELKEGFTPKKGKVYSLSREEREEVQAFVEDQLRKGYIRPSKSPQTSSVHFVAKKNGERVQKGIAHWDKQNHAVPAPNCVLKVREEIIKVEGL